MSIVKITYFLPEDKYEYNLATRAADYKNALWDFDRRLRDVAENDNDLRALYAQEFRDLLFDFCEEYQINLNEWE